MKMTHVGLGVVFVSALILASCAMWSDNSRPALLAGDADVALFQTRTSKSVSKASDANSNTMGGGSTASPTGGGAVTLDPAQLKALAEGLVVRTGVDQPVAESTRTIVLPAPRPMPPMPAATVYHTVKRGDNLWDISRKHGTTVAALKRANGLKSDRLQPGQTLKIP